MGLCPKCGRNSVFYNPYLKMARCCYKSCGFNEKVPDEKSYFDRFEKDTEDYARRVPSYDLSFTLLKHFATAYRLNGHIKLMHRFYFFSSTGQYTGENATSLKEFAEKIRTIDVKSLEFHFYRGDFDRWIAQVLGQTELAEQIINLQKQNPVGEMLRSQLYKIVSKVMEKESRLHVSL